MIWLVDQLDLGQGAHLELPLPVSLANVHESGLTSYATAVHFVGAAIQPQHAFVTLAKGGAVLSSQATPQGETLATRRLPPWSSPAPVLSAFLAMRVAAKLVLSAYDL